MRKAIKWRNTNQAVLYLRVSSEEQARDNRSLESQESICREFCSQKGWTVTEVFTDAGVSAWADVERPAFRAMIEHLKQNKNTNLVFLDYSRFGRHTRKALTAFDTLDGMGVVSTAADNPGIDCTMAAGRTARRDELSKAEDFSDKNSEKTSLRMKAAFEDGRWLRDAPLGYTNVRAEKGQPNIVPDEATSILVTKAFELMATGNDRAADVLRAVTELGLRSRKGKVLTLDTFLKTLRNPVYVGKLLSKRWKKTVQGRQAPIVDEQTFRNVQLILKGKKSVIMPYKRRNPDFPLRGFIRCSECSTPLTAAWAKGEFKKVRVLLVLQVPRRKEH